MSDVVNSPPHYRTGPIEVIEVIEGWNLGYHLGNVIKYLLRAPHKGEQLQDLQKAQWYLERYIAELAVQEEVARWKAAAPANDNARPPTRVCTAPGAGSGGACEWKVFTEGDEVWHPAFGSGVVRQIDWSRPDAFNCWCEFDEGGFVWCQPENLEPRRAACVSK